MIQGIRHIIFDLGGVILNIDYLRTEQAFKTLGIANFGELYSQLRQTPLFDELETGRISARDFISRLQQQCGPALSREQILSAWNAMLLDFPLRRLQLLQQLRLHYDMVLLSNTNEIHEAAFNQILSDAHGLPGLASLFDKVYFSHRLGMRKPHAETFQKVLDDTGFEPSKTLFIDDSPQHIAGAQSVGIQTIYLEPGMTIEDHIFLKKDAKG